VGAEDLINKAIPKIVAVRRNNNLLNLMSGKAGRQANPYPKPIPVMIDEK
jgi:hypothetical protein